MKKSELHQGDIVKLVNGLYGIIIGNKIVFKSDAVEISRFNEDLVCKNNYKISPLTICKVYRPDFFKGGLIPFDDYHSIEKYSELIYERFPCVELDLKKYTYNIQDDKLLIYSV